jgi:hypothetical protein
MGVPVEIAQQWPIVALVLALLLGAGRIIQQQYKERIAELREDVHFWREIALTGTNIADATSRHLADTAKRRVP